MFIFYGIYYQGYTEHNVGTMGWYCLSSHCGIYLCQHNQGMRQLCLYTMGQARSYCLHLWIGETYIWRLCCQKQVSQAGISNYIPHKTVGCNYLSLPVIPASGNKVLTWYIPEKMQWIHIIDTDTTSQEHSAAKQCIILMGCTIWVILYIMLTSWNVTVCQVIVASGNVSITKVRDSSVYILWVRPPSYCLHNWIGVWCIYSTENVLWFGVLCFIVATVQMPVKLFLCVLSIHMVWENSVYI